MGKGNNMSNRYKAVLFDLDGTLLDTLEDITDSINEALKNYNWGSIGVDSVRRLVGNGARKLVKGVLAEINPGQTYSDNTFDTFFSEYSVIYRKNSEVKTKPYKGVSELLEWLKNQGIYTGVLSNKPHSITIDVLQFYFPCHKFDFIAGQREGVPRKPDPAGAIEFCETLGLSANEVLFVGDSEVDLETGQNAGIDCVGVLWGFRDEDTLKKCGAKALIKSPADLKSFLTRLQLP